MKHPKALIMIGLSCMMVTSCDRMKDSPRTGVTSTPKESGGTHTILVAGQAAGSWPLIGARFPRDGKLVAWFGKDENVHVLDMASGKEWKTITGHSKTVVSADFSPDSKRLTTIALDGTLRGWDLDAGKELFRIEWPSPALYPATVSMSPDGRLLASGSGPRIGIWRARDGEPIRIMDIGEHHILDVEFLPDSKGLVSIDAYGNVHVWDTESGQDKRHILGVIGLAVSRNSNRIAVFNGAQATVLDAYTGEEMSAFELKMRPRGSLLPMALSAAGSELTLAVNGEIRRWDVEGSRPLRPLMQGNTEVMQIEWSPVGRQLVSAGRDGSLVRWELGP